MPELTNVQFTMYGPGCMSNAIVVAAQAVGDGRTHTCLVLKGWHNLEGRYYQGGANAADAIPGDERNQPPLGNAGVLWNCSPVCRVLPEIRQDSRHDGPIYGKLEKERPFVPRGVLGPTSSPKNCRGKTTLPPGG